jgi:hypothetical protein
MRCGPLEGRQDARASRRGEDDQRVARTRYRRGGTVERKHRWLVMVCTLALVGGLAACAGAGGPTAPDQTATGTGSPVTTVTSQGSPGPTVGGFASSPNGIRFTLAEGAQRDICGIHLRVKFIPPSVTATQSDQAFLVGAPIISPTEVVPDSTPGDQPVPSTVAPARAGETTTLLGKRFVVDAVDVPNHRVELQALC